MRLGAFGCADSHDPCQRGLLIIRQLGAVDIMPPGAQPGGQQHRRGLFCRQPTCRKVDGQRRLSRGEVLRRQRATCTFQRSPAPGTAQFPDPGKCKAGHAITCRREHFEQLARLASKARRRCGPAHQQVCIRGKGVLRNKARDKTGVAIGIGRCGCGEFDDHQWLLPEKRHARRPRLADCEMWVCS